MPSVPTDDEIFRIIKKKKPKLALIVYRLRDIETFYEFLTLNWHIHGLVVKWKFVLKTNCREKKVSF